METFETFLGEGKQQHSEMELVKGPEIRGKAMPMVCSVTSSSFSSVRLCTHQIQGGNWLMP